MNISSTYIVYLLYIYLNYFLCFAFDRYQNAVLNVLKALYMHEKGRRSRSEGVLKERYACNTTGSLSATAGCCL